MRYEIRQIAKVGTRTVEDLVLYTVENLEQAKVKVAQLILNTDLIKLDGSCIVLSYEIKEVK
jgi:hypothetical protein